MTLPWGSFFHPLDSRGRESRTLWWVSMILACDLLAMFTTLGLVYLGKMAAGDFQSVMVGIGALNASMVTVLGAWIARDWQQKTLDAQQGPKT
jgi:hypothetical protein